MKFTARLEQIYAKDAEEDSELIAVFVHCGNQLHLTVGAKLSESLRVGRTYEFVLNEAPEKS